MLPSPLDKGSRTERWVGEGSSQHRKRNGLGEWNPTRRIRSWQHHSGDGKFYVVVKLGCSRCKIGDCVGLPKEGGYDYTACWSGVSNPIAFSKTHNASSYEFTGTTRSNPSGGMFDKNSFRCVGMTDSFNGKVSGRTVCETNDGDGDKRLTVFSASDGKVTREFVAGTGKYEGMEFIGTVEPLGPFPVIKAGTIQDCNHQTGTYKLK